MIVNYKNQEKKIKEDIIYKEFKTDIKLLKNNILINKEYINNFIILFDEQQREKIQEEIKKYNKELKQNRIKYMGNEK